MNIHHPIIKFKGNLKPLNLQNVSFIILHHIEAKFASVEEIHQWHLEKDFGGFAYNEYIKKDGSVYIGRGDFVGSQCKNMNSRSYGIAVEGDYESEMIMPTIQKQALVERIQHNKKRFKNLVGVFPHSYFTDTKCPGKFFPMKEILSELENKKRVGVYKLIDNLDDALKVLVEDGQINSPEYRKKVCDIVNFETELMIKLANRILELKSKICENPCK